MNESIKIEVFIISKNHPDLVERAINSVLLQTIINLAHVVVSENSDDDAIFMAISVKYPQIEIRRRKSLTEIEHFQQIVSEVVSPYFVIFNDIDFMYPKYLESTLKTLVSNEKYIAVGVNGFLLPDRQFKIWKSTSFYAFGIQLFDNADALVKRYLKLSGVAALSGYMYRLDAYKNIQINTIDQFKNWNLSFILSGMIHGSVVWLPRPLIDCHSYPICKDSCVSSDCDTSLLSYLPTVSNISILFLYGYYIYKSQKIFKSKLEWNVLSQIGNMSMYNTHYNLFNMVYPVVEIYCTVHEFFYKFLACLPQILTYIKIKFYQYFTRIIWIRYLYRTCRRYLLISIEKSLKMLESNSSIYYIDKSCMMLIHFYQYFGNFRVDQFGLNKTISKHVGLSLSDKVFFEHSLVLYDKPPDGKPSEEVVSPIPIIGVMSKYRKSQFARLTYKPTIAVGPYVLYANPYTSRKVHSIVNDGKVLLIFPSHSTETYDILYDADLFFREIESISINFSKVLVCLFYHDLIKGQAERFLKRGYEVVTAGHRYDPFFLEKLRAIIELCDSSMSNSFGSHIGYCVALGKPHYVFRQDYREFEKGPDTMHFIESEIREIVSAFDIPRSEITQEQLNICDKYWGLTDFCNPEQLKARIREIQISNFTPNQRSVTDQY